MKKVLIGLFVILSVWAGAVPAYADGCPEMLGRWGYGLTFDVAADENYVYVGNGTALRIFNISDPAHPASLAKKCWMGSCGRSISDPQ